MAGALGIATVLLLTACGDSSPDSGTATPAETEASTTSTSAPLTEATGATTTTEATTTEATAGTTTTTEAATTTTEAASGSSGSCLVGSWVITQEEMNGFYDAVEAGIPAPGVDFTIEGDVLVTFTEDTYVYNGDFTLEMSVGGGEGLGESTGSVSGTYEAVDGVLVTTVTDSSLELTVTVNGITMSGDDMVNGAINANPLSEAPFDCDGPTIFFQVGAGGERHPVRLTPA